MGALCGKLAFIHNGAHGMLYSIVHAWLYRICHAMLSTVGDELMRVAWNGMMYTVLHAVLSHIWQPMLSTTLEGSQKSRGCVLPHVALPILREGHIGRQLTCMRVTGQGNTSVHKVGWLYRKPWWGTPLHVGRVICAQVTHVCMILRCTLLCHWRLILCLRVVSNCGPNTIATIGPQTAPPQPTC